MAKIRSIALLGDGGWGTTLSMYLSQRQYLVKLWGAFPDYIKELNRTRENVKYLPGIKIPPEIDITDDLAYALEGVQLVVLAIPSEYVKSILNKLKSLNLKGKILLSVIKGVDTKTLMTMSQVIEESLGKIPLAILSGPTIAREVALGIPSTAVIASSQRRIAQTLQTVFNSNNFRIYTNADLIGVELGGSIKNIIAIACGICDGLKLGTNTKAAIMTRGLAEMARLGVVLGAKQKTFMGLTGLGDLVTTCMSHQSRNRYVGEQLGQGKSIPEILSSMPMVAEGVVTTKAVYRLSLKHRVTMPITNEIYKILYKNKPPSQAVADLMKREAKSE